MIQFFVLEYNCFVLDLSAILATFPTQKKKRYQTGNRFLGPSVVDFQVQNQVQCRVHLLLLTYHCGLYTLKNPHNYYARKTYNCNYHRVFFIYNATIFFHPNFDMENDPVLVIFLGQLVFEKHLSLAPVKPLLTYQPSLPVAHHAKWCRYTKLLSLHK